MLAKTYRALALACIVTAPTMARAWTLTTLHNFTGKDGGEPLGLVINRGTLYGFTELGTAYKLNPNTSTLTTLYKFTIGPPDSGAPKGDPLFHAGLLYGTTASSQSNGTAFAIDPKTGSETILHNFGATQTDGVLPYSNLIAVASQLYGTTTAGGNATGCGTIFRVDPISKTETPLYSFSGPDGCLPYRGLVHYAGALYGTSFNGGTANNGIVFKFNLSTGHGTVLYRFLGGTDGASPYAGLTYHAGALYGTTKAGGATSNGTVFQIDPKTSAETILHSFTGADGSAPLARVTFDSNGDIFGTTSAGGPSQGGTVYSLNATTGAETVLHGFASTDPAGNSPNSGLLYQNSMFYGTTFTGGTGGRGSVFKLTP